MYHYAHALWRGAQHMGAPAPLGVIVPWLTHLESCPIIALPLRLPHPPARPKHQA